nr:hypothetical protein [Acetatifactor sp.]
LDLFKDFLAPAKKKQEEAQEKERLSREKNVQEAILKLQKRYGKNAVLKGVDLEEGATKIQRNEQIGGHKA